MEEEEINITRIIAIVDNKKSYSIDVDVTTSFYEFKKILAGSAHLIKNSFRIFHEQQEYTNEYDDNTIQEIFPNYEQVSLIIISDKDPYEYEDELISVRFNINSPCQMHIGKYKILYCFSCNKSICMECFIKEHKNHKVEDKSNYLAPAQLLMNNIFSDSSLYKADSKLSKYINCIAFRSNLKLNYFYNIRKLIDDLELKIASCLEYFNVSEDETEKNTNENLELLKKYCIENYIKLKNDINTKGIIMEDDIFLTFYQKLKEIEEYKNEFFEENQQKFIKLNSLLVPFINQIAQISKELTIVFQNYLNNDIYDNFKSAIQENIVKKIENQQVNNLMFKNIKVPRKSIYKNSLCTNISYKKKGRNTYNYPDKMLINQQKENNPFINVFYSPCKQDLDSKNKTGYYNNQKNEKENCSLNIYSKNEEQKKSGIGLYMISDKNIKEGEVGIYDNNLNVDTTNINIMNINNISNEGGDKGVSQKRIEEKINSKLVGNLNNMNITGSEINNNKIENNLNMNSLETNINNINKISNVDKGNPELTKYRSNKNIISNIGSIQNAYKIQIQNNNPKDIQQKYNTIHNINSIPNINNIQVENKIIKMEGDSKTIIRSSIIEPNRTNNLNINTNISTINSINKLNHMNKKINNNKNNKVRNSMNTIINSNIIQTEEYGISSMFLFMHPIFNSNKIIGAIGDECTGKIEVNFRQAFGDKDIQLNKFPQGGAFCNFEKSLYFTGGQETQKGVGKIFLRITMSKTDLSAHLISLPSMIYSHCNHSIISDQNYVFVIGGYNSNKCEYFNLKALKWDILPDLNSDERQRPILVLYKDYLYVFMGYTQFSILDSIERININELNTSKWEKVPISNPENINIKFFGSGIYNQDGELYLIGGKVGFGNEELDYNKGLYIFNFDKMTFSSTNDYLCNRLYFIENKLHYCNNGTVGNFIEFNDGYLASISLSYFQNK